MADLELAVGDFHTVYRVLEARTYSEGKFGAWTETSPASATVLVYSDDPEDYTEGTVESATATTVVDATFNEAADYWNGLSLRFTSGDCAGEVRAIGDFDGTTGTFSLAVTGDPLPATPAAGDTFRVLGYPIITLQDLASHADGNLTTAYIAFNLTSATTNGVTATPGRKRVVITPTWTGAASMANKRVWVYTVDVRP